MQINFRECVSKREMMERESEPIILIMDE